ncbi:hypothetical protein [Kitasatospora sp. NPDC101183]|uniref:hypothetical protein n=1 Tax=Kitasatospora sp. NPDC101183 TaxID=3364100 RepID=UPI003806A94B
MDDVVAGPVGTADPAGRVAQAARTARDSGEDEDGHAYWAVVEAAAAQDAPAALRCGLELLASQGDLERAAGCDLLGRAAEGHEDLRAPAADALLALAAGTLAAGAQAPTGVLTSLVCALGRTGDVRAVPVLAGLAGHEDADLRHAVASFLPHVATGRPDGQDVRALIGLTRDRDPWIRDWAAFALGTQLDHDTPAVREALWACATDAHEEVRREGVRGLARRHDARAVPLVAQLLAGGDEEGLDLALDAAEVLGSPALLPALGALTPRSPEADRALAACDPDRRARTEDDAWAVVVELERLRPGIGAALAWPRCESVHGLRLTCLHTPEDTAYDAAALLARAGGDPARAAALVLADLDTETVSDRQPV